MDLYHGGLRARDADGKTHLRPRRLRRLLGRHRRGGEALVVHEVPVPARARARRRAGTASGRWRACSNCDFIPTPLADARARRSSWPSTAASATGATLGYHWARMIEMLHAAEKHQGPAARRRPARHRPGGHAASAQERGVGVIEAPRGTLIHHYRVDENDQVVTRQPDRLHHPQQPGDERGDPPGGAAVPRRPRSSPRACSTTSRWPSAPSTPACPAPPTRSGRCRSRSSSSTPREHSSTGWQRGGDD